MTEFEESIKSLREDVDLASERIRRKKKCVPTMLLVAAAIPFVVWIVLYYLQPSFVQKKEGGKYVRDNMKVLKFTVIVSVVFFVALYLFSFCRGSDKVGEICSFR